MDLEQATWLHPSTISPLPDHTHKFDQGIVFSPENMGKSSYSKIVWYTAEQSIKHITDRQNNNYNPGPSFSGHIDKIGDI